MNDERIERDSLGEVRVPRDAYWGAQTQRAIENFPVSGIVFPPVFIKALVMVKHACARVNEAVLEPSVAGAIIRSCDEIMEGKFQDQFPLDIYQTGSGTSTNMNVNEVIATRANEILTGRRTTSAPVHPNNHVNRGQSSNDVMPTALHVAVALQVRDLLLPAMQLLHETILTREVQFRTTVKTGRTHLMDAMPLTLGQEMSAWSAQTANARARIEGTLPRLEELAIGGTAVGTGVTAPPGFGARVARALAERTGLDVREAANHFEAQAAQDAVAELSGLLKSYATVLIKIANDLRWMSSGPAAGLAEIRLPSLQPGSSIMPGKVNPVIPEAVRMAATQVIGNDAVVTIANAMGEFQLNVMLPVIAHNILQSIGILSASSRLLARKAIEGMEANVDHLKDVLDRNLAVVTVLSPLVGYERAAEIAAEALLEKKTVKHIVVERGILTVEEAEKVLDPVRMTGTSFKGE